MYLRYKSFGAKIYIYIYNETYIYKKKKEVLRNFRHANLKFIIL